MTPESAPIKESQFVWRRFLYPLEPWSLPVPSILILAVLILILAFRHREELKQLSDYLAWYVKLTLAVLVLLVAVAAAVPGLLVWDVPMMLNWALWSFFGVLGLVLLILAMGLLIAMIRFRHYTEMAVVSVLALVAIIGGGGYAYVGYQLREAVYAWLVIMVPVLLVAAFYIGAMYYYDSRSVHALWASFLGLLRASVYALLGVCFLLPGCQEYDTTITESKVLILFDVSGSMDAVDGQEGESGITRQEKIISFLTTAYPQGSSGKNFLEHLTENSPVACYRFGTVADDEPVLFSAKGQKSWHAQQWRTWFRPDKIARSDIPVPAALTDPNQIAAYIQSKAAMYAQLREGTDVGGSVLQILQREGNSRIQSIIVFSDGNSNRGDEEAIRQVLEKAGNVKRPIHVITVGVGDYKQPVRIRIEPLIAPQTVRADDSGFEVRVPVYGDGLPGEEFEVTLTAQRVKDRQGIELKKEKVYIVGKQKGKFGGGQAPDEIVFKVKLEEMTKIKADEDTKGQLQGQWNFTAQMPRHAREAPDKDNPVHLSQPKPVMVNDTTLRVLLFASGPSRDYQFVRVLFAREQEAKRAKLSIYLQSSKGLDDVHQDVDGTHLLNDFPNKLEKAAGGKKVDASKEGDVMNLKSYDVIICFDPDWTQLSKTQLDILKEWVTEEQGGIIFVGGPQHMQRLIPPVDEDKFKEWPLKQVFSIFPVVLARNPPGVKAELLQDTSIPYTLDFTGMAKGYDFLKLDEDSFMPLAGWEDFFGPYVKSDFPGFGEKIHPLRGFHGYLRVAKVQPGGEVLATFGDPKAPKTLDTPPTGQPYLVSRRIEGKGKSFYIGSGELWRMRTFKEDYHQRFWIKLARYVSSGSGAKSFGRFLMAGEFVTGKVQIAAEVFDKDGAPLNPLTPPSVTLRKLDGSSKDAKLPTAQLVFNADKKKQQDEEKRPKPPGTPFSGEVVLDKEGQYEISIDIPGTTESITHNFEVKSPNVEMSNLRTNFPKLFSMATEATPAILARLDRDARGRLEGSKDRPQEGADSKADMGGGPRLFFLLANAQPISQCIAKVRPEEDKVKGRIRDLWPEGPEVYNAASWDDVPWLFWSMLGVPAFVMGIVVVLLLLGGRWMAALGVVGVL
ncbi:MAG TPA: vWA domain-containing protein, partial [Gemmataceae bacterium]|nr:vWA domain-containing protein [Gemmataceae bacterium]